MSSKLVVFLQVDKKDGPTANILLTNFGPGEHRGQDFNAGVENMDFGHFGVLLEKAEKTKTLMLAYPSNEITVRFRASIENNQKVRSMTITGIKINDVKDMTEAVTPEALSAGR